MDEKNELCIKHDIVLEQQNKDIKDLTIQMREVLQVIAVLPSKVDTQTKLLEEMKDNLKVLTDHQTKLAVLENMLIDYNGIKSDVLRMKAEWFFIKFVAPTVIATIVSVSIFIIDKIW